MASSLRALKNTLRKEVKKNVLQLSVEEKARQSRNVIQQALKCKEYQNAQRVSIYLSMDDEVDTDSLLRDIFASNKSCYIPRYEKSSSHMDMVRLKSLDEMHSLPLTSWNIKQHPLDVPVENALESGGLDLVFVPGLAFTSDGWRCGRGRGYYDNFLRRCQSLTPPPFTIALAFTQQMYQEVPTDENDMQINSVLFPV